ncbi:hypothetical protein Drose_08360 [Dactylosporangium roseum]|uniref:Uncharacterized protein n=1 Tax=Dactylosporangium roseum TaxID=47989 RepID=A0ABY5Z826_9ACTN|nr:DUF6186 family protein [Dactylosporangium roseum]UWZ38245.1 hypothetical protein Drose_08360 [Dactylosporangium roseum]
MTAGQVLIAATFAVALGLFGAVEFLARREGSKVPTLGEVCGVVMRYRVGPLPVGRIAMFGFWWWLGWHFLAR